tara:strand:- start:2229 stop:2618 length:390 start_codon:yes stop_codon:yes gene_type:complete
MENRKLSEEEEKKLSFMVQLYSTIKQLQVEIEKQERSKRYFSIFVSGCITYFIVKILHIYMETEANWVVFLGAYISLCLHYFVDSFSRAWNQVIGTRKFKQSVSLLEAERQKLNIDVTLEEKEEKEEKE